MKGALVLQHWTVDFVRFTLFDLMFHHYQAEFTFRAGCHVWKIIYFYRKEWNYLKDIHEIECK